jgi:hypothetical protein
MKVNEDFRFDDSYISFRYAKNLSEGYGLVWNKKGEPTEGYTNFLLVLILSIFIKIGFDPLFSARILSFLSLIGIGILVYKITQNKKPNIKSLGLFIVAIFLILGNSFYHCVVGLETVEFTFFIFFAFYFFTLFVENPKSLYAIIFSVLIFISFLLRPETLLLLSGLLIYYNSHSINRNKLLKYIIIFFIVPVLLYFLFKYLYFGNILPNPFYIKTNRGIISKRGVESIISYYKSIRILIILVLIRILYKPQFNFKEKFCLIFILTFTIFYTQIDTLSDVYNRFLYPVTPFIFYLTLPLLVKIYYLLFMQIKKLNIVKSLIIYILFFSILSSTNPSTFILDLLHKQGQTKISDTLMVKRIEIGEKLKYYNDNTDDDINVAYADAGALAYYFEGKFIDIVGLNNNYIAHNSDNFDLLVDYFFALNPTLAIIPATHDKRWIDYGHGTLGNYQKWMIDRRWNNYMFAGIVTSSDNYELYFFVNKGYNNHKKLLNFIDMNIVDENPEYCPIPYGDK